MVILDKTFQQHYHNATHLKTLCTNSTERNDTILLLGPSSAVTPLVNYHTFVIFNIAINFFLESPLALFGCVSNAINIAVYLKMGMAETTTINFLALSTIDLLACATIFITVVTFNPFTLDWTLPSGGKLAEIAFAAFIVLYPCLGCGAWVTALLSVERCLCIVLPLKVKTLVTTRRITVLIAAMAVYELTFICLMFVYTGPPYVPSPSTNDRKPYMMYSFSIPSFICFVIIFISTIFLVIQLRYYQNQAWLKSAASTNSENTSRSNRNSKKEQRAARLVILICSMFLICFAPNAAMFLATTLIFPDLQVYDPYLGLFAQILFNFSVLFQTMSSSLNLFVYYATSSKYRAEFRRLIFRRSAER